MLAVGFEETPCHVLRDLHGLLHGSTLGYQPGKFGGCGEVAATFNLFNMQSHSELIRYLRSSLPQSLLEVIVVRERLVLGEPDYCANFARPTTTAPDSPRKLAGMRPNL